MPLHLITPFDRDDVASSDGEPSVGAFADWRRHGADLCYILLKASAFLGAIYLMVLGLPLLFFLMLTGGDLALLFVQLGNLSVHYLAADHAARASFGSAMTLGLFGVATLITILRIPRFLDDVSRGLSGLSAQGEVS